jgi:hypothetical protein
MIKKDLKNLSNSPSVDFSAEFERALSELDQSFAETMLNLQALHQKKMELISLYKESKTSEQLLKVRNDLKGATV